MSGIPWTQCRYGRITYFSAFLNCPMVSFAAMIPPGHASVHLRRRGKFNSNHKQLKCMATVKVKLRESTVGGKAGVIYYQLCHRRKSQQVTTSMRLQPRQWDARRGCVITPLSGEAHALLSVQQRIDRDLCLLHTIIRDFEFRQEGYSLRMLSIGFASPGGAPCSPMSKRRPQGSRRTESWGRRATTGGHSGVSPISWADGTFPFRSSMNGLWGSMTTGSGAGRCPQYRLVLYADIACSL